MIGPPAKHTAIRCFSVLWLLAAGAAGFFLALLAAGYLLFALHPFNLRVLAAGLFFAVLSTACFALLVHGARKLSRRAAAHRKDESQDPRTIQ